MIDSMTDDKKQKRQIQVIPSDLYALLHTCVEYTYEQFREGLVTITIDGKQSKEEDFMRILDLTRRYVK